MGIFSSLTNRIFVASALLAGFSLGVGIYHVNDAVTTRAERELLRGLDEARTLIEENRRIQVEHFTREARLIADLPRLKAAVELDHAPTVQPVAEEYQQQLAADLFLITNRRGQILSRLPARAPHLPAEGLPGIRRAAAGRETSTFVPHADGLLQLVSVPIWINPEAPDILGTLSVGFSLDRYAAARFRSLMNSEIAFGTNGRIHSSTLPASGWPTLVPLLDRTGVTSTVVLNGSEYIAMTVTLDVPEDGQAVVVDPQKAAAFETEGPTAKAIILRSRTERLSSLAALHASFFATAVIIVIAATVLSYGIARTVTGPLKTITATMREMAATGDLTRKIPASASRRWEDEDARILATTFNQMTESIERFQREAAQRERLSSLGRLSTVVAHEIRNPLMIIKAALRGLKRENVDPGAVKTAVTDIEEEVARLNRIVTEVLDFARPIHFDVAPADVNAVCADAARAVTADGAAPTVRLACDPRVPSIQTDAERLRLALVNVLNNAQHAIGSTPDAPVEPIVLRTALTGDRVAIEVRDHGPGIPPADLPRVFDPFFTTRRTGTGLGLAICRNIVEGLRGTIAVESPPGQGTTVRIELPVT